MQREFLSLITIALPVIWPTFKDLPQGVDQILTLLYEGGGGLR